MTVYGKVIPEISWSLVGLVWLYSLAWMVVLDIVKLRLYRRLDDRNALQAPWISQLKRPLDSFGGLYRRAIR